MSRRTLTRAAAAALAWAVLLAACSGPTAVPTTPTAEPTAVIQVVRPRATSPAGTQAILFDPLAIAPLPDQKPQPGACLASRRVPRAGAYRCSVESGATFDPCFAFSPDLLGCEPRPEQTTWSAVIAIADPLPDTVNQEGTPMAIYLDLGPAHPPCSVGTTAPKTLNDQPVTYTCAAPGAWVLGPLDTATDSWTADYVTTDSQGQTVTSGPTTVDIARAWLY